MLAKLDRLPKPGMVLGSDPERRKPERSLAEALWLLARALVPSRRGGETAFVRETRARQGVLDALSKESLDRITDITRKLLSIEGSEKGLMAQCAACVCEASRRTLGQIPHETQIIAQGVKTQEQQRWLKSRRCDQYQGYLYSRPLPASQLVSLLLCNPNKPGKARPTASL